MTNSAPLRHPALGYAALAAAGSLWGTGFALGKFGLAELTVGQMMLLRFAFASIGLAPVVWHEQRRQPIRIERRDVPLVLAAAFLGGPVQFLVQFQGLARTTVTHASLMVGVLPVFLAVGAAIFSDEQMDAISGLGLAASTIGAALVAFGTKAGGAGGSTGHSATLVGDLLVVASLFAAVAWILMSQALMRRYYSPVMATGLVIMIGTAMLAIWVFATDGFPPIARLSLGTWLSVAAMGVLASTAATLLWNWGLLRVPASQAGVFVNLEPIVGAILGVVLFHDVFGALSIAGGLLIIGAAVVVSSHQPG